MTVQDREAPLRGRPSPSVMQLRRSPCEAVTVSQPHTDGDRVGLRGSRNLTLWDHAGTVIAWDSEAPR